MPMLSLESTSINSLSASISVSTSTTELLSSLKVAEDMPVHILESASDDVKSNHYRTFYVMPLLTSNVL